MWTLLRAYGSDMRRYLRALTVILVGAGSLALPMSAASAAREPADIDVSRYGGADRYATSLLVAEAVAAHAGGRLDSVVMVSGRNWTDAVVAAPLAGSLGAPVLATPSGELRADAARFLQRTGVSQAVLIGADSDTEGVGSAVSAELEALDISAERVTGTDQYATSVAVARRLGTPGDMGALGRTAVVASGEAFADALVAGAFAAHGKHPILLTEPHVLHPHVAGYLSDNDIEHVVLMGGTAALHEAIEDSIAALGIDVTRIAGATRYDTAVKAAELVADRYGTECFSTERIGVARAHLPFDSFSAGPLLARLCAPLVLTDPGAVPASTIEFLNQARTATADRGEDAVDLRVFGGDAAVSQASINTYIAGFSGATNPFGSDGLQTASGDGGAEQIQPCVADLGSEPMRVLDDEFTVGAAWSPDCSKIVFLDRRNAIWTARIDGTDRTQLTPGRGVDATPAWSPDGTRVAFSRYAGRFFESDPVNHIFVVNADGTGEQQLTSGNHRDRSPTWSPDSTRIAFSRHELETPQHYQNLDDEYIALMDADGGNLTALTRGGTADRSPSWSPDGSQIAYGASNDLWVMDTDGRNARRVPVANTRDGYSWSPDGTAIAFITFRFVDDDTYSEGKRVDRTITIAEIDGTSTAEVLRYSSRLVSDTSQGTFTIVRTPRWAPDGRSILFERNSHSGTDARAYVAPVPGLRAAQVARDCRPIDGPSHGVGFPIHSSYAPSTGALRVAVLFMEFPDARAAHSTQEELSRGNLQLTRDFFDDVSYGSLDIEFVPHHEWLRAPEDADHYLGVDGSVGSYEIAQEAASQALDDFDFTDIDALVTILPGTHFSGARLGGTIALTSEDDRLLAAAVNIFPDPSEGARWGGYLVPLTMTMLGAPHLGGPSVLASPDSQAIRPDLPSGHQWQSIRVGTQGFSARFPARFPVYVGDHLEPPGWTRWQLGWLAPDQIACINRPEATVQLAPLAGSGEGTIMAAVPAAHNAIIVIESRRRIGYDRLSSAYRAAIVSGSADPALAGDRVLVYVVDPTERRRSIRFAGDNGYGYLTRYPLLTVGESVSVAGYTINVVADDGDTHTVTVIKSD